MGGAGIEKGQEALPLDHHLQQHRVLRPDTYKCMEGHDESVSGRMPLGGRLLWWYGRVPVLGGRGVLRNVVPGLQVEEPLTQMSRDVGLVAVVA